MRSGSGRPKQRLPRQVVLMLRTFGEAPMRTGVCREHDTMVGGCSTWAVEGRSTEEWVILPLAPRVVRQCMLQHGQRGVGRGRFVVGLWLGNHAAGDLERRSRSWLHPIDFFRDISWPDTGSSAPQLRRTTLRTSWANRVAPMGGPMAAWLLQGETAKPDSQTARSLNLDRSPPSPPNPRENGRLSNVHDDGSEVRGAWGLRGLDNGVVLPGHPPPPRRQLTVESPRIQNMELLGWMNQDCKWICLNPPPNPRPTAEPTEPTHATRRKKEKEIGKTAQNSNAAGPWNRQSSAALHEFVGAALAPLPPVKWKFGFETSRNRSDFTFRVQAAVE
jgi:hypothetical protein